MSSPESPTPASPEEKPEKKIEITEQAPTSSESPEARPVESVEIEAAALKEQETKLAEAGARLEAIRINLGIDQNADEEAPVNPEAHEAKESDAEKAEKPKDKEGHKAEKEDHHEGVDAHGPEKHKKHDAHGHEGGHAKPKNTVGDVLWMGGSIAGWVGLEAGATWGSGVLLNAFGLTPVVANSLTSIGLASAGLTLSLASLVTVGFLGYLGYILVTEGLEAAKKAGGGILSGGGGGGKKPKAKSGGGGGASHAPAAH